MKIRNDYVSNSSSSSFILNDSEMFKHFNIGKKEILDALYALMPEDSRNENCVSVFDMHNEADRKEIEEIRGCLKYFNANWCYIDPDNGKLDQNESPAKEWYSLLDAISNAYDCWDSLDNNPDEAMMDRDLYDENNNWLGSEQVPLPKYVKIFIKKAKKQFGILDNWELAHRPETRYIIHFGDNEINNVKDFHMPGKWEELYHPEDHGEKSLDEDHAERNELIKKSTYETEQYSYERLYEILMNYWESTEKIDKNDSWFKRLKGNPHFVPLVDDTWSYCLHEG